MQFKANAIIVSLSVSNVRLNVYTVFAGLSRRSQKMGFKMLPNHAVRNDETRTITILETYMYEI